MTVTQKTAHLQVIQCLHLLIGNKCQPVHRGLCHFSELLLLGGIAQSSGPVPNNVISVPRVSIHRLCTLLQSLSKDIYYLHYFHKIKQQIIYVTEIPTTVITIPREGLISHCSQPVLSLSNFQRSQKQN